MRFERRVSSEHFDALARVFGDVNPLHIDAAAARAAGFDRPIGQGAVLVCFLSEIIGRQLGIATPIFCGLEISFEQPFYEDDWLSIELESRHHSAALGGTSYGFAVAREGERIAHGEFLVKEPRSARRMPPPG